MWVNINQQSLSEQCGGGCPQIPHKVNRKGEICEVLLAFLSVMGGRKNGRDVGHHSGRHAAS